MLRSILLISALVGTLSSAASAQSRFDWSRLHQSTGGVTGLDCNPAGTCVAAMSTVGNGNTYLLRSSDQGVTWDTVYLSVWDTSDPSNWIMSASPGEVQFLTDDVVLVALDSAYILRSEDVGMTWRRVSVSTHRTAYAGKLLRISSEKVLTTIRNRRGFRGFEPDSLFISTDRGMTWSPTPEQPKLSTRSQTFSMQGLYSNGGGRFGTIVSSSLDTSTTMLLTETTDDGRTWEERVVETPTEAGAYGVTISFFDSDRAVLTAFVSYDSGLVMRTWDGGETWSTIFFGQVTDSADEPVYTGMLTSSFLDSTHGIAGTRWGVIETMDGGYSWQPSSGPIWVPLKLNYITLRKAVALSTTGGLFAGVRDITSVNSVPRVSVPTPTILAHPGEHLALTRYLASPSATFTIIDVRGGELTGGSLRPGAATVPAPEIPGLYVIRIDDGSMVPTSIRVLVSGR